MPGFFVKSGAQLSYNFFIGELFHLIPIRVTKSELVHINAFTWSSIPPLKSPVDGYENPTKI